MPINLYSIEELDSIASAAVKTNLPELDPSLPGSFIRALVSSNAILVFAAQRNITEALNDFFPQTSSGEFLDYWAEINALSRVSGTVSEGYITVIGTLATSIPSGSLFASSTGYVYTSTSAVSIAAQVGSVALSSSGADVTAVTPVVHSLIDGLVTTISGASDAYYNGPFTITVLDENTFTYTATSAPSASTDSGSYSADFADIPIESNDIGADKNIVAGGLLTLQSTVAGLPGGTQGTANRDGITGGADLEDDESLRTRVLLANSIDPGVFTNDQIRLDALSIPTATRVFITNPSVDYTTDGTNITTRGVDGLTQATSVATADMTANGTANLYIGSVVTIAGASIAAYNGDHTVLSVTSTAFTYAVVGTPATPSGTITVSLDKLKNIPQPGIVYIFVLDDNNTPPVPSSTTLTNVENKIEEKLPAHTIADNVIVSGAFFSGVDITITGLSPDTTGMRQSITDNLNAFFEDSIEFATDIKRNKIITAIQNTQDLETGNFVDDFILTVPSDDVSIGNGTIGIIGTITFA